MNRLILFKRFTYCLVEMFLRFMYLPHLHIVLYWFHQELAKGSFLSALKRFYRSVIQGGHYQYADPLNAASRWQGEFLMWQMAMKGLSGSGKSTIGRALSKHLGWPLIDKDDVKDLLDGRLPEAGGLAYDIMFQIARRQLLQGLNVICDSPLTGRIAYAHAQAVATETYADLVLIECICSNEALWRQRIDARKTLGLPAHHQIDWDASQDYRRDCHSQASYPIVHPHLVVDTVIPLHECLAQIIEWLEQIAASSNRPGIQRKQNST